MASIPVGRGNPEEHLGLAALSHQEKDEEITTGVVYDNHGHHLLSIVN